MLILPHPRGNHPWTRQNCSVTGFSMTPDNAIQSLIFQTRNSGSVFSWSQSFITYAHAAPIPGAIICGHSTPVQKLPSTSLVWCASFPTLALSRLILHCHWKQSLCVSYIYGTRFPTLWWIQSNYKSHGLGHNSQDSEVSESVFLGSHSSATLSSPAKLSDTLFPQPHCAVSSTSEEAECISPDSFRQYHSYPQNEYCHNVTSLKHRYSSSLPLLFFMLSFK